MTDPAMTVRRHLNAATALAHQWAGAGTNQPSRHTLRTNRLRASWPELAALLDAIVETAPSRDDEAAVLGGAPTRAVSCPECAATLTGITGAPDPRTGGQAHRVQPCGHPVTREQAVALWEEAGGRLRVDAIPADGAALVRAEVIRARTDLGHTLAADTTHKPGDLAWAAWSHLDRVLAPTREDAPTMWPWPGTWKPARTPMRGLIIAAGFIVAEIDRRLSLGERVGDTDPHD